MCCQLVHDNVFCLPQTIGSSIKILITWTSLQIFCHIYWYKKKLARGPITMQTHAEIFIDLVYFSAIFAMACIAKMAENQTKSTKISACVCMFRGSLSKLFLYG